jgi:hypothetical protein
MERKKQAIVSWNSLLSEARDESELIEWLKRKQESHGLCINGSYLCSVLRPYFLPKIQLDKLARLSRILLSALSKTLSVVLNDEQLLSTRFSQFHDWIGRVCSFEADIPIHASVLRFDATFVDDDVRFIELNADMPQIIGFTDELQRVFLDFPGIERFREKYPFYPMMMQPRFLKALVSEWDDSGSGPLPRICLVTWSDDPVRWGDMLLNQQYFAARGVDAVLADPRELEFDGKTLCVNGKAIDIVFRVIGTEESLKRSEDVRTLIKADNACGVLMINSYRGELLGHKALFAILSDPDIELGLDAEERDVVRCNLPWTRLVYEHRTSDPSEQMVDLVPWVCRHKDALVLKPSHAFGGHGVALGWKCSPSEWEKALQSALDSEFVVQQRVPLCQELYPTSETGIPEALFFEDIDPYILGGRFAGILARLSQTEITNVHAGGSIAGPFVLL